MEQIETRRISYVLLSAGLGVVALVIAIIGTVDYFEVTQQQHASAALNAQNETTSVIAELERVLLELPKLTIHLANEITDKQWREAEIKENFEHAMRNNSSLYGIGVAFEPYAYNEQLRLYSPYIVRKNSKLEWVSVDDYYDYTAKEYSWYVDSLYQQPSWSEPYYGQASQAHIVEYVAPVYSPDGIPMGVVFVAYELSKIQAIINHINLERSGYSITFSSQGKLISHPVDEYVNAGKNIVDLPAFKDDPVLESLIASGMNGETSEVRHIIRGKVSESIITVQPVPGTGWTVLTVRDSQAPYVMNGEFYQHQLILILAWIIALCVLIISLVAVCCRNPLYAYWSSSLVVSCAFLIGIGLIWYVAYHAIPSAVNHDAETLLNEAALQEFVSDYTASSLSRNSSVPTYIPTGLFVQSLEFNSAHNVVITGYVWQQYKNGIHDSLTKGVVFPEAESLVMEESYRRQEANHEVIGWYFRATLRESFDYSRYPLDQQTIWIRLWHSDFDRNVILLPDLEAYDHLVPDSLPGVEKDFVLSGWTLIQSYYEFRRNSYNVNFGIDDYVGKNNFPELYFNIGIKRNFLDPFVSNLSPVVVVLVMLFAIVTTISKKEKLINLTGFNASRILASCSALFFVVLISHIDMRSSMQATELIFMENFFFLTYIGILMVSLNAILFTWGLPIKFITYQDNLLPKILFLPAITGMMFVMSLWTFY